MTAPCSLEILQGAQFQSWFEGSKEISSLEKICHAKEKIGSSLYLNRWQIIGVMISSPFRVFFSLFLKAISFLCYGCNALSLYRRFYLKANHVFYPIQIAYNQLYYGKRFIFPLINDYKLDDDFYPLSSIPKEKLHNIEIKNSLHPKLKNIRFDLFGKLCHGSIHWYTFLFLKGLESANLCEKFDSYLEYAKKIAITFFSNGQPKEAALLQALFGIYKQYLPLDKLCFSIPLNQFSQTFLSIPDGMYIIETQTHALGYFKKRNEKFVIDPLKGGITIENSDQILEILHEYLNKEEHKVNFFWTCLKNEESKSI